MKKLLKFCTIGGMALVIAACGNGEEETDTGDEAVTEETETAEEGTEDTASEEEEGAETESEDNASEEETGSESEEPTEEDSTDSESGDSAEESGTESEEGTEETETDESAAEETDEADAGEEQSKTFVLEEEGFVNELVYYHIDDEVQRQTSESDITYEALGVEDEEQARELLEQEAADYESVDGVEHNIEYDDEGIVETLEVDYTVAEISEISSLEGAEFDEEANEAQFISMEQSEEQLLNSGYELAEGE